MRWKWWWSKVNNPNFDPIKNIDLNRTTFKHVDPDDDKPAILPKENETAKKSLKFDHISKDEDSQSSFKSAASDNSRKRQQEEIFGSLSDDEELCSAGNLNAQLILFYCDDKCLF